jgi:hypothetical protein
MQRLFTQLICLAIMAVAAHVDLAANQSLLPSAALHGVFEQLRVPATKQGDVAKDVLSHTQISGLSRDEQFALAELYFAALMPKEATAAYTPFMAGNDQFARTATQRVIFMKMAAFQNYDPVAADIVAYRKKFPLGKNDLFGLDGVVNGLSGHHRTAGNHDLAASTIIEEIESLPKDAPYMSYRLLVPNIESFQKAGKQDVLLRLIKQGLALYADVADAPTSVPEGAIVHRPGVVHRVEQRLRLDYAPDWRNDDGLIATKKALRDALTRLNAVM